MIIGKFERITIEETGGTCPTRRPRARGHEPTMSKKMLRSEQLRPALVDPVDITAATTRGRVTVVGEENRGDRRKRCAHIARRVLEARATFRLYAGAHTVFRAGAHTVRGVLV